MAELTKKFYGKNTNGNVYSCKLYTTTNEVGDNRLAISASLAGAQAYAKLGPISDSFATGIRVVKNGTTYAVLSQASVPYAKNSYTTAGTFTFTVPSGVTKLKLTIAGGGGGGGGGYYFYDSSGDSASSEIDNGGTGGTGELVTTTITVSPGTTYNITVGAGGAAGHGGSNNVSENVTNERATDGSNGGTSSFGSNTARAGGGGYEGAKISTNPWTGITTAENSASYSGGGAGGAGGKGSLNNCVGYAGTAGSSGWVYVEYGVGV